MTTSQRPYAGAFAGCVPGAAIVGTLSSARSSVVSDGNWFSKTATSKSALGNSVGGPPARGGQSGQYPAGGWYVRSWRAGAMTTHSPRTLSQRSSLTWVVVVEGEQKAGATIRQLLGAHMHARQVRPRVLLARLRLLLQIRRFVAHSEIRDQ